MKPSIAPFPHTPLFIDQLLEVMKVVVVDQPPVTEEIDGNDSIEIVQRLVTLDDLVQAALPAGWRFASARSFDGFLTRLNGARGAPATPSGYVPGVLTAVNSAAGALPSCRLSRRPANDQQASVILPFLLAPPCG